MKKLSLLILSIILVFPLFFCCGCQKKEVVLSQSFIMLASGTDEKGRMSQMVRFGVNSDYLEGISTSQKEILEFKRNLVKEVDNIRKEFLFSFAIKYLASPIEEFQINKGVILTDCSYLSSEDAVGFDIIFTSPASWQYYNDGESKEDNSGNIFLYRKVSKGKFPFSSVIKNGENEILIGEKYKEYYLSSAKELSFYDNLKENYKPQFIYNYFTPLSILRSDANLTYRGQNGYYHHIWVVENDKLCDNNEIKLSITLIYKGWWLFLGLMIPISIMTIAIIYVKIREKKEKK